ncbi:MAG: NAD+ synthase [Nitrospirae bacterium CG_4_10_14_0_8_um_filter_41_23]|nr:NAD+ synthase [Nitrospirota bacterium]OIP59301.1 MAG: NAD+ synthase [Nitrospirae bacterium CG2_30_41_42]PIQ94350.1 MAG: NAD+ synthase [Nitrospirae bacterium CG11_big_fil_rev_8_21_14_0_20_41_14]PIV44194.1 MAG: NAD+ synthase [Nitrospirae bacterium CG02_land_8_20_14_3_00_41_53]PIW87332.1 MAG: NAD+ synthase [Nitrospirae bacterium CG_4_8_14_3_um_filter_41_47]PIY86860.1 MAG: NAD+ synthase [Nitrospirae bacterium CG_4_10_14_0_8_um_filter_41_23]PJA79463.1 MAG: NAD+ synthase [Nitrospirae bacterium C
MKILRIALAQINPTVGDLDGNVSKILNYIKKANKAGAQVVAFPELAITGYPPEDLLLKTQFIEDNLDALEKVRRNVGDIVAVVGFVDKRDDIYNAAAIIHNKRLIDTYHKMYLPNYGVFDEYRYFQAGTRCPIYQIGDTWIGVNICEDIWYPEGPSMVQSLAGAEVILNINASPYRIGKGKFRENMLSTRATDNMVIVAYLNTVGGQDELVFDGHSFILDQDGIVIARGKQFEEDLIVVDLDLEGVMMRRLHAPRRRQEVIKLGKGAFERINVPVEKTLSKKRAKSHLRLSSLLGYTVLEPLQEVYMALVLGTSDYVTKNGFKGVVIGLSGGIDSSLVASIAVDAIGKENVTCLFMPSPYTSMESREDAYALAGNLGIKVIESPIDSILKSYLNALKNEFQGLPADVTEENLQARIRGNILMAFSNKFGWLVLTTGNKSEMSVGYATLYGDMAGGFAVIKDVPKTMVYELCKWKNNKNGRAVVPERVILKEPSAELKPAQKDTDTLPPYPVLDPILKAYIEDDKSFEEILSLGCNVERAQNVIKMIDKSEYKRRQAPPGIKITQRAFGKDRRFPITNKYRGY